jgi:hypothetical protein
METDKPNELKLVGTLISNSLIHLELYENSEYNLFMAAGCNKPEGTIYFATTPSLVCLFLEDKIKLQDLLERCPSFFVEIVSRNNPTLYSLKDSTIELREGDKTIKQLTSDDPIEIW